MSYDEIIAEYEKQRQENIELLQSAQNNIIFLNGAIAAIKALKDDQLNNKGD